MRTLLTRSVNVPAYVVAILALLVAFGGGASATRLITGAQIQNGTLTGADVKNHSLGTVELTAGARRQLRGARGGRGARGAAGAHGASFYEVLPRGRTVVGAALSSVNSAAGSQEFAAFVALPFQTTRPLTLGSHGTRNLYFGGPGDTGLSAGDVDATICSGSYDAPTAPAGTLCVYPGSNDTGAGTVTLHPGTMVDDAGPATSHAFVIDGEAAAGFPGRLDFVWAYTAP